MVITLVNECPLPKVMPFCTDCDGKRPECKKLSDVERESAIELKPEKQEPTRPPKKTFLKKNEIVPQKPEEAKVPIKRPEPFEECRENCLPKYYLLKNLLPASIGPSRCRHCDIFLKYRSKATKKQS